MIVNGVLIALDNAPTVVWSFQPNFTRVWSGDRFWGRIVFGIPGLVEGGLAYFWLTLAIVLLFIGLRVGMRPKMQRKSGLWIVTLSILSIPIGGGFYIGAILGAIAGLYAMEFPKPFRETFVGKITSTLMGSTKVFEKIAEDSKGLQTAVLVVILVAFISGLGSILYSFNLSRIYPTGVRSQYDATAASNILLQGKLYTGVSLYISVVASLGTGILKWLVLSLLVYFLGAKLLNSGTNFGTLTSALAFVYVPETLFVFAPVMFPNEPYLSLTWQFMLVPISWPLILYYISHLWAFAILVFAIEKTLDLSRGKAVGTAIMVGVAYFMINYIVLNPILRVPGVRIEFTGDSSMMILFLSSIALLVAVFLGAFRKE
jgi:hypothetical protein